MECVPKVLTMDRRTAPNHAQLNIPLQTMGHSEPEEDDDGYVHSSRLEGGASACPAEEAPRRPSVPFHTRNLIRQLPSRNLGEALCAFSVVRGSEATGVKPPRRRGLFPKCHH